MSEIIEADRCDECRYYDAFLTGVPRCGIDHIRLDDVTTVPTWCPLDDPVLTAAYNILRVGKPVKQSPGLDELREMAEKMGYTIERKTA